jgi:sensor histidine kinase regulating citrate/malate metabolism
MSGELILLVEDEHNITDLAALYLKKEGFRIAPSDGWPQQWFGLAHSKQIVEAHRGTISVESKIGSGSTFIVRLPLAR